jgi:hypothetical protein
MTLLQQVDEYFIENRNRVLEIAAFLDRFDRAPDAVRGDAFSDFRMEAFRKALAALAGETSSRVNQIQEIFSDPTTEPLEKLTRKSARGAYEPQKQEAK